ncbi:uncharacterized protein F5Z01DRAFT_34943 [Emericellopsis atlantica]|uniref:Uncharacterized protein n=1 Tax=Emericellopsis atlantica TaxID=2614577 RepID=A0A9P8CYA9_9HYPO|nr:uncharacterized protein F5Z01DRAFT_34943 [Emericellopsis atlantica]KAG9259291.1 hypothetical protein F5Z01DRAFT_34943 [Emericellopsis atlantica]
MSAHLSLCTLPTIVLRAAVVNNRESPQPFAYCGMAKVVYVQRLWCLIIILNNQQTQSREGDKRTTSSYDSPTTNSPKAFKLLGSRRRYQVGSGGLSSGKMGDLSLLSRLYRRPQCVTDQIRESELVVRRLGPRGEMRVLTSGTSVKLMTTLSESARPCRAQNQLELARGSRLVEGKKIRKKEKEASSSAGHQSRGLVRSTVSPDEAIIK